MDKSFAIVLWISAIAGFIIFGLFGAGLFVIVSTILYELYDRKNRQFKERGRKFCKVCDKKITGEKAFHPEYGMHCMDCYNEKIKPKKKLKSRWKMTKKEIEEANS